MTPEEIRKIVLPLAPDRSAVLLKELTAQFAELNAAFARLEKFFMAQSATGKKTA